MNILDFKKMNLCFKWIFWFKKMKICIKWIFWILMKWIIFWTNILRPYFGILNNFPQFFWMNIPIKYSGLYWMNILDFVLNWILNWIIFRPDLMKKLIFKTDRPGLLLHELWWWITTKFLYYSVHLQKAQTDSGA